MAWIKPDNFIDVESAWTNEPNAYDGNLLTSAVNESDEEGWQPYLRLLAPGWPWPGIPQCTKVRLRFHSEDADQVDIDIFGYTEWVHVYEGVFVHDQWIEYEIPGGVCPVVEMRIRFYDTESEAGENEIYEAEFWQVAPVVTTQAVDNIKDISAKGHGNITDVAGEDCDKRGFCWNKTGAPTIEDDKAEEADGFGAGAFALDMTELDFGTTYYVKAYAHNAGGYGYGNEVEFTTRPHQLECVALIEPKIEVSEVSIEPKMEVGIT